MFTIDREAYGGMYGPTTGDKIRLADTDLIVEIEKIMRYMARNVNLVDLKQSVMVWDRIPVLQIKTGHLIFV